MNHRVVIFILILIAISFLPQLFLTHGDRLAWQLSNWAWIFASLLIGAIGIIFTIHYTKGKHILQIVISWLGCIALVIACLISLFIAMVIHDEKIWSNKDYVVYSEYNGFIDPEMFVLYKRDGLIDRCMFYVGDNGFGLVKEANFSIYNNHNLIKEEIEEAELESDSVFHRTIFYRLTDGYHFEQDKNDSLLNVIMH